jgi:hypothetical protein
MHHRGISGSDTFFLLKIQQPIPFPQIDQRARAQQGKITFIKIIILNEKRDTGDTGDAC